MTADDNVPAAPDTASSASSSAASAGTSSLVPARVQKVSVDRLSSGTDAADINRDRDNEQLAITIELFAGGKRAIVVVPGRFDEVPAERPARDPSVQPPSLQGLLRKELVPSILSAIDHDVDKGVVTLLFARKDLPPRTVILETDGRAPRLVLVGGDAASIDGGEARILAALPGARPDDGRDTRRGRPYEKPRRAPAPPTAKATTTTTTTTTTKVDSQLLQLRQRLKSEHDRLKRLIKALVNDLDKHGDADAIELDGELLKTVMGRLPRGVDHVDVVDFEGNPRTLTLDPARDAKQNLAQIFARARRARAAAEHIAPRLSTTSSRAQLIAGLREQLRNDAPTPSAIETALRELSSPSAGASARRRAATSGTRQAWRAFKVSDDVVVRVGRGAKDNDALVKSAKGNDLWLHARDRTGAHAIIPAVGSGAIADDVVLDACHLVAWFSQARGERHVDIQHTRVKHLKKPGAGAPAGLFLVANETVLHLRVDDERIKKLLAAEVAAG